MTNVTQQDIQIIISAYYQWKNLNTILKKFASRTVNFPEAISEALVCYQLGYNWHNKAQTNLSGDATYQNKLVEIKATSNFNNDLTSFSPDTKFDILIFARLDIKNDNLHIYDLNMNFEQFQQIQVSRTQTVLQQQQSGRRPRFSIITQIIKPRNLEPIAQLDIQALAKQLQIQPLP